MSYQTTESESSVISLLILIYQPSEFELSACLMRLSPLLRVTTQLEKLWMFGLSQVNLISLFVCEILYTNLDTELSLSTASSANI